MGTSYSAPDIFHRIRGGHGSGAFQSNSALTEQQANLQSQINTQVTNLNTKMNASWTGNASDQAVSGAAPLATASDSASAALNQASSAMQDQVGSFHTAYNSVVPMASSAPPNNIGNELVSGLGINTPLDQQISQYNAAGQQNVQVYNTYSSASATNAAQMPTDFGTLPTAHPDISVLPGPSGPGAGSGYSGFTSPTGGSGATPPSGYSPPGAPRTGTPPVWTSPPPSETRPPLTGPQGGNPWEPPPTTIQSAPPTLEVPPPGGWGPGDPRFTGDPAFFGPGGTGNQSQDQEEERLGGPGGFNSLGEPTFGEGGGFGGPGGGFGGPGGVGTGASAGGSGGPGAGNRSGAGFGPGAEEAAFGHGGMGGGPGGPGAMGAGRGAKGEEDEEHKTAEYLQEADPDAIFGTDQMTVTPVIG